MTKVTKKDIEDIRNRNNRNSVKVWLPQLCELQDRFPERIHIPKSETIDV